MSEEVTKTAFRIHLPHFSGKEWEEIINDVRLIVDPDHTQDDDDLKYGFDGKFRFWNNAKEWYVDCVLAKEYSYEHPGLVMSFDSLASLAKEYLNKFNVPEENLGLINVVAVTWYNGVDEPFTYN